MNEDTHVPPVSSAAGDDLPVFRSVVQQVRQRWAKSREKLSIIRPDQSRPRTSLEAIGRIGRRRERDFALDLTRLLGAGVPERDALQTAVVKNFRNIVKPSVALRKAKMLLAQRPWINEAMSMMFDAAGLSLEDATTKHVEHIRNDDPEVSLRGLEMYYKLTIPKAPQKVDLRMLGAVDVTNRTEPPAIQARILEAKHETD